MASLLLEHGADRTMLEPLDEFLGACLSADGARARELLSLHPTLFESMTKSHKAAMTDAVHLDRPDAVRLMVHLGFALDCERSGGGTPLHWAAWLAKIEMVDLLIALGSPIDLRDCQYGCSALGWAAHGSCFHRPNDDAYCAIVDRLIDAGATREFTINKWGEKLSGTPRVAERFKERFD